MITQMWLSLSPSHYMCWIETDRFRITKYIYIYIYICSMGVATQLSHATTNGVVAPPAPTTSKGSQCSHPLPQQMGVAASHNRWGDSATTPYHNRRDGRTTIPCHNRWGWLCSHPSYNRQRWWCDHPLSLWPPLPQEMGVARQPFLPQ